MSLSTGERSKATLLILYLILCFVSTSLIANDTLLVIEAEDSLLLENNINNKRATIASIGAICGLYVAYDQFQDIWGESSGSFHLKSDDWDYDGLAQNDEFSHFMASKLLVQFCGSIARWVGFTPDNSLWIGVYSSALLTLWVEIVDGYNPDQGFGVTDLVTGSMGITFEALRQKYPSVNRFDMKVFFKGIEDIPPTVIIAEDFKGYDNTIYLVTYRISDRYPIDAALGYSTRRSYNKTNKYYKKPVREYYVGVGISGTNAIGLIDKKFARKYVGFLDWFEISLLYHFYSSDPVNLKHH